MVLGMSYSLWDSEELLEYSIRSIRSNVDYISVVYQEVSNHGEPCDPGLYDLLLSLKKRKLIDAILLYTPNMTPNPEQPSLNETNKRQLGLELSRVHGCTHHITIDCDEFYTDEQFKFMKSTMEMGYYSTGYCQHRQYYHDNTHQLAIPEGEYVATIEKILPSTQYIYQAYAPDGIGIDPTRKTNNISSGGAYRVFTRQECEMHHMSFVRKDIRKKLSNHSSRRFFTEEQITKVTDYYNSWTPDNKYCMWAGGNLLELIEVPKLFDIYE